MLLHRCFPRDPSARPGTPGSWDYLVRPQRQGRWDNSDHYDSWYVAFTAAGAIAETFATRTVWTPRTFLTPAGHARVLATFEIPDDALLFDFDSATNLAAIGVKPSEVIRRSPPLTQSIALKIFQQTQGDGTPAAGVRWWSSQLPSEDVAMLWSRPGGRPPMTLVGMRDLSVHDADVIATADSLRRQIDPT